MMNIQESHINFDESRFADLRKRIAAIRWPEGASFNNDRMLCLYLWLTAGLTVSYGMQKLFHC